MMGCNLSVKTVGNPRMTRDEKYKEITQYLYEEIYGIDIENCEQYAYDILRITEDNEKLSEEL